MTSKTYYDEFLKVDGEDICVNCDNIVKFENLNLEHHNDSIKTEFDIIYINNIDDLEVSPPKSSKFKKFKGIFGKKIAFLVKGK